MNAWVVRGAIWLAGVVALVAFVWTFTRAPISDIPPIPPLPAKPDTAPVAPPAKPDTTPLTPVEEKAHPGIPRAATGYRRDLTAAARLYWGLSAPIPTFAGQIHQESAWNLRAESPYAQGLTQFTPATAKWMKEIAPELGEPDVWNPVWAMRAMARYDRWLWDPIVAANDCERMAFALSGYNGGIGWTRKDIRLAALNGSDPQKWFGHVELHNGGRAEWAFKENRGYPRNILKRWEPLYESTGWGDGVCE